MLTVLPEHVSAEEILERLDSAPLGSRSDLTGGLNRSGGSAGQFGTFAEFGRWFFKTSMDRRFVPGSIALSAEIERERLRLSLGIYPPDRIWFVSNGDDGAVWCCSLTSKLPVLRELFNAGADARSWELYLEAFGMSFQLAAERDILLDCNPNNFAIADGRVYYVDDDLGVGGGRAPFGHQALLRLREYENSALADRRRFLEGFAALVLGYRSARSLQASLLGDLQPQTTWPTEPELRATLSGLVDELVRSAAGTRKRKQRGASAP